MLPPSRFAPWVPGVLYAELYFGLCRALIAPWLMPWAWNPVARPAAAARAEPTMAPAAATSGVVSTPAAARGPSTGASIIPFDRGRTRTARV